MSVNEYGETAALIKPSEDNSIVIMWMVRGNPRINPIDNIYGKKGDRMYKTSCDWIVGLSDKSDYFEPAPRERSLRPCILRAMKYVEEKFPGKRVETH